MKVLLTAITSFEGISGVQRHALNLAGSLLRRGDIEQVHLVIAPWQHKAFSASPLANNRRLKLITAATEAGVISRNLWHVVELPKLARKLQIDVVHLTYPVPVIAALIRRPIVVTLHDLYPFSIPENFGGYKSFFNRCILRLCLRQSDAITCVSDATLQSLLEMFPQAGARGSRVYNIVEPSEKLRPQCPRPRLRHARFLLCVAQHRKNKNIAVLLQMMRRLLDGRSAVPIEKLVIVGASGPETPAIRMLIQKLDLARNVLLLEGLSEAELQWCYRHTALLVAPSSIEGFGLPVVEAIASGCPVVCSDIRAFREVGRNLCHYVTLDANASSRFADEVKAVLDLPRPAPVRMARFSSDAVAEQYLAVYGALSKPLRTLNDSCPSDAPTLEKTL